MNVKQINKLLKEIGIEPDEFPEGRKLYNFEQTILVDDFIRKFIDLSDKYGRDRNHDVNCMADRLKEFDYSDLEIE